MHPSPRVAPVRRTIPSLVRTLLTFATVLLGLAVAAQAPALKFTVTPAATGEQTVRVSLPLPRGLLRDGGGLAIEGGGTKQHPGLRVLGRYSDEGPHAGSARRALLTFVHDFANREPVEFEARPGFTLRNAPAGCRQARLLEVTDHRVRLELPDGPVLDATLQVPPRRDDGPVRVELVESSLFFTWWRFHFADSSWARVIEVRLDPLGGAVVVAHLQRNLPGDGWAPDVGWELALPGAAGELVPDPGTTATNRVPGRHAFGDGSGVTQGFASGRYRIEHPAAPLKRKGHVETTPRADGTLGYRYWRCRATERVPMQQAAWQRAEFVLSPSGAARPSPTLETPHAVRVAEPVWTEAYGIVPGPRLGADPWLARWTAYHRDAIVRSMAVGDDWGNVTSYSDGAPHGSAFGMNRLNHARPIFAEAWRSGDRRLRETALLWCDNFHDQSIWWGPGRTGGTRYNNARAQGRTPPDDDRDYMWRSNDAVHFCTKGYDAFLLAYEDTGDPRMRDALEAQVAYAATEVHADRGECRNVGDVRDFLELHRWTGNDSHRRQALRLFRELRTRLSTGDLFDQGGKPLAPDPPFLEEDNAGLKVGYAKPYIIGYALTGLPELARVAPGEPRLRDVVSAVADFLADSQDPVGGWRYPHPRSSHVILGQALEHAWQLVQAARLLGPKPAHLDAIERVLRQRLLGLERTGRIPAGLTGWEYATGTATTAADLYARYARPADRDPARDHAEGRADFGSCPPEGLVYFTEVLAYYLEHRPAERLRAPPAADQPLGRVLQRQASAVRSDGLPTTRDALAARLRYPLSWLSGRHTNFAEWRAAGRAKVRECLLAAPPQAPFDPVVVAEQDRGTHVARKLVLQLTADSRVPGYLVVPKGPGPFPAVLLLHDHGARFDIGKEKVIEPFDDRPERLASAREWVGRYYGGRFLGDELARRGYVCFASDALNWSDRGGAGYDGQQALAANLLHLGTSWAGLIAHEDLRAAEFLATRPEVDARRVAAMGLSMGCFRTWQVAALSDRIAAGVAVGWMSTVQALMTAGNNQTRGQSAYSMTHPGLSAWLDYPDVASLAAPKPMLFYNGTRDPLFPVPGVEVAFARMRKVWDSQGAGDRLVTKFWDVPHLFDAAMQDAAFAWLDARLKPRTQ